MTSDEVLTALRCCASDNCNGCPLWDDDPEDTTCADGLMAAAADLIEFQQQGLEALTKMDEALHRLEVEKAIAEDYHESLKWCMAHPWRNVWRCMKEYFRF